MGDSSSPTNATDSTHHDAPTNGYGSGNGDGGSPGGNDSGDHSGLF